MRNVFQNIISDLRARVLQSPWFEDFTGQPSTFQHPQDVRAAAHEAGHALVASRSYGFTAIHALWIGNGWERGIGACHNAMEYSTGMQQHAKWGMNATMLAGIAGEMLVCGSTFSQTARPDLDTARQIGRTLVGTTAPWSTRECGVFDPSRMFVEGSLSPEEKHVMREAYAQARYLLKMHDAQFRRIQVALIEHRSLDDAMLKRLGLR